MNNVQIRLHTASENLFEVRLASHFKQSIYRAKITSIGEAVYYELVSVIRRTNHMNTCLKPMQR